ncbi:Uncharacterized protein APZ42_011605 [Daphnia magna]|uniref:Uncharacterized protein n=1 Tax=Daphnia magna TaxID=35525 RepID=A0A162CZG1_9CRUS|nr:Uncharacterized protein APZ42_011605 [Daphnia magna]
MEEMTRTILYVRHEECRNGVKTLADHSSRLVTPTVVCLRCTLRSLLTFSQFSSNQFEFLLVSFISRAILR